MKTLKFYFFLAAFLFSASIFAQSPNLMNYQAVIRNASNTLVANASVGMKVSILQGSATGTEVYKELFNPNPTTNANGLVTVQIGSGIPLTGTFSAIDWSAGPYFVKIETDPTGATNYSLVSTSQLMSVPYAMYAAKSGGGFSGTGTANYLPKFTGANSLGNSRIVDDGTDVTMALNGSFKVFSSNASGIFGGTSYANSYGGVFTSTNYRGVYGMGGLSWAGIYGDSLNGNEYAGSFNGKVQISNNLTVYGSISKASGTFKIDHPLDPENKYLYHSFVESPDMMNVYNGNIKTDASGTAVVKLPSYFEALNKDFRYQLTVLDEARFAQARISQKINGNQFTIVTDKPNVEVSWQVTGIRHDKFADAHRVVPEVEKPKVLKGTYLHPKEWGKPESKGITAAMKALNTDNIPEDGK